MTIIYFENIPNEIYLLIFSYLTKFELLESFLKLNSRFNILLLKYIHHINLSSILKKNEIENFINNYLPVINSYIYSITIDNYQIGYDFIEKTKNIQLKNLSKIKLIDNAINLQDDLLKRFQLNTLNIVITSLNQEKKSYKFFSTSLKKLEIEFEIGEYAKDCLLNEFNLLSTSILVDIRIVLPKLSDYFQLFNSQFSIHIEKFYVSILSIDEIDYNNLTIFIPDLIDFQLEICQISFDLIKYLLPLNKTNNLQRLAFIGQTTTINAKLWKILLEKYSSIKQFDLYISNTKHINLFDIQEWNNEFPKYSIKYNLFNNSFQINLSKFDIINRIYLNESINELNHIKYSNKISHLIIRSQYWCSYFPLSFNIQNQLLTHFNSIRRLSTTYKQLEYFLKTKFLNQIQQLDIEFSEKYCYIKNEIAQEFLNLKSIYLSSMYDGIHELNLHTIIKDILLNKFINIIYIHIDSIQINDDKHVENTILQWYSSQINLPTINYIEGKFLSIQF